MLPKRSASGLFFLFLCQLVIKTLAFTSLQLLPLPNDDTTCSKSKPCRLGCCGPM
ncbi:hypothetical protein BDV37DRAFT_266947 [Aspergillus pseudonomiae]|uniref:Uncharacterized protein n=1 Tax=Aspergillus pseudonomiae TaxID=1506151 RepID=A0A5N7CS01_9EURO|nr:uncharacterized protein BDV37DRAFT_266947 [Aspergillus pseudonomiae]KAE8396981.1 hypothetical protein BDV37DRAFT_266947 [Aspergillus pseudonomiae]